MQKEICQIKSNHQKIIKIYYLEFIVSFKCLFLYIHTKNNTYIQNKKTTTNIKSKKKP